MLGISRASRFPVASLPLRQLALAFSLVAVVACGNDGVGEPCIPETIPEGGYKENENYVESSSVQCRSRVCIVNGLRGVPQDLCKRTALGPQGCPPVKDDPLCRDHEDSFACNGELPLQQHVYCTCRCDGPRGAGFEYCECPDGFECSAEDILSLGGDGIRGKYCVRSN